MEECSKVEVPLITAGPTSVQMMIARVRASFLKNFAKQRRQIFSTLFQLFLPVLMMIIIIIVTVLPEESKYNPSTQPITLYGQIDLSTNGTYFERLYNCYDSGLSCSDYVGFNDKTKTGGTENFVNEYIPRLQKRAASYYTAQKYFEFVAEEKVREVYSNGSFEGGFVAGVTFNELSDQVLDIELQVGSNNMFGRFFGMVADAYSSYQVESPYPLPRTEITIVPMDNDATKRGATDSQKNAIAQVLLIPFALTFLISSILYQRAADGNSSLQQYIRILGVSKAMEDAIQYVFDYLLYLVVMLLVLIIGLASSLKFFNHGHPAHYLFLMFLWGHVMLSMIYFLQHLIRRPGVATTVGYVLTFGFLGVAALLNLIVFGTDLAPWWYLLFSPLVFYRCFVIITYQYINPMYDLIPKQYTYDQQLMIMYACMIGEAILFFAGAIAVHRFNFYYEHIQHRITIPAIIKKIRQRRVKDLENQVHRLEEEDIDCAQQRRQIEDNSFGSRNVCLIANDIEKSYGARTVLQKFSLAMDKNECFALLGKNGAGKTSLIKILCQIANCDSGTITVNGYSLKEAHKRNLITLCPQFDILFDELTVEDHILFMIRLKRAVTGWRNEYQHAEDIISNYGLEEARRRIAKDLSGGMKRRLSIAMAMTGSPSVVLLDEPTTGLDPSTRRDVWKVINGSVKSSNRCVMLTTHSMEEAEALCDRIGIMRRGSLKCIGSVSHLKNRFDTGYKLTINIEQTSAPNTVSNDVIETNLTAFVQRLFREARLEFRAGLFYTYRINRINVELSEVFNKMDSDYERQKHCLDRKSGFTINWSLNSSSLEELFFKIVKPIMEVPLITMPVEDNLVIEVQE